MVKKLNPKNNRKTQKLPETGEKMNYNEAIEKDKPLMIRQNEDS